MLGAEAEGDFHVVNRVVYLSLGGVLVGEVVLGQVVVLVALLGSLRKITTLKCGSRI